MTWSEYREVAVRWPHVRVYCPAGGGALLYFGAEHVYAPDHPQNEQIESLWDRLGPTLALNEGGHPPSLERRDEAIARHGEPGLVRHLALREDVPVTTLEPPDAEVLAFLRRTHPAPRIKMFHVLRAMQHFSRRETDATYEEELERVLGHLNRQPGLRGAPRTPAEVEAAYREISPSGSSRDAPAEWFDSARTDTEFSLLSRQAAAVRDRYMVRLLGRLAAAGERVFAVVGGTHVVMQEAALEAILGVGAQPVPREGELCQNGARD